MITFLSLAVPVTLIAIVFIATPLLRGDAQSDRAPVAALLAALAIPVAVILAYPWVSNYPWSAPDQDVTSTRSTQDAGGPVDLDDLRQRLAAAPDLAGWLTLGNAYLSQERFAEARDAYRQAIALSRGGDDEIRIAFAEAAFLADRTAMEGEAGQIIDDILKRDPSNPRALWYGGLMAIGRGDVPTARARWNRLLELSPPPQVRQIIEQQIAALDSGAPVAEGSASAAPAARKIPVRIQVAPELATRIRSGASLFLIARSPGATGPPLAVVRRQPATLPMDVEIGDSDSMMPGRSIAGLEEIRLTARVANGGDPIAAPGDIFGDAVWRRSSVTNSPIEIVIDKVVD